MKRRGKQLLAWLLAAVLLLGLPGGTGTAGAAQATETYEAPDGSYILTYSGQTIQSFTAYENFSGTLAFPSELNGTTITTIGSEVFSGHEELKSVVIPDSVTVIGAKAFRNCTALEEVKLPAGLTAIANELFSGCSALKTVNIPATVKNIGTKAFQFCSSLDGVNLPDGLTGLETGAFQGCTGLTSVAVPGGLTVIGDYVFSGCTALKEISLPEGLETIGMYTFEECTALEEIEIPGSVTSVEYGAFMGCSSLIKATIYSMNAALEDDIFRDVHTGFVLWGYAGSTAETKAEQEGWTFSVISSQPESHTLTVEVTDPEGGVLTEGFTVYWYLPDSAEPVAQGPSLTYAGSETAYEYQVVLDEALAVAYLRPERQAAGIADGEITCTLTARPTVAVSGKVTDGEGTGLAGVTVTFTQTVDGTYTVTKTAETGADGAYALTLFNAPTDVRYERTGWYTRAESAIPDGFQGTELQLADCVLTKLPSDKITLSLKLIHAAEEGKIPEESGIHSFEGLTITAYNQTQGGEVAGLTAQYPYLILEEGSANPGDVLLISAADESGVMGSARTEITLDGTCMGTGSLTFTAQGGFSAEVSAQTETRVMVFGADGTFLRGDTFQTTYTSGGLPDGTYSLVFLERSDLLRSAATLESLAELGLQEGVHYVLRRIEVEAGVITAVTGITVPELDEEALYYTRPGETGFKSMSRTGAVGQYILLHGEYAIDSAFETEGEYITILLPQGAAFVQGSVTLDGTPVPASFDESTRTVRVNTNAREGVIRLYVIPTDYGSLQIQAYLSFRCGSDDVKQPLGTVALEITAGKIAAPPKTNWEKVTVTGLTLPNSTVTLYDNGVQAGTTTSRADGRWQAELTVKDGDSALTHHEVYAVVSGGGLGGETIRTDSVSVLYYEDYIGVSSLVMTNTGHGSSSMNPVEYACEFDFVNPREKTPQYWYWPSYPTFTFQLTFTNENSAQFLSEVYVVTQNACGEETRVPMEYDAAADQWLGTHDYSSEDIPVSVSVSYYTTSVDPEEVWTEYQALCNPSDREITVLDENSIRYRFSSPDEDCDATITYVPFASAEERTRYLAEQFGPEYDTSAGGEHYYYSEERDQAAYWSEAYEECFVLVLTVDSTVRARELIQEESGVVTLGAGCGCTDGLINSNTRAGRQYNIMYQLEHCSCIFGDADEIMRDQLLRKLKVSENLGKIAILAPIAAEAVAAAGSYGDKGQGMAIMGMNSSQMMPSPADGVLNNYNANIGTINQAELWLTGRTYSDTQMLAEPNYRCECPRPRPGRQQNTDGQDADGVLDPSGYVCEAVPSNRLEGVTATLYYRTEENGTPELWDADEYGQSNPLVTDANGQYAWFVPQGEWQVKYEKAGYETAYSQWLPVPPPQTEVNVAMTAQAAPAVERVTAYLDRIEVAFTQYMDIGSVEQAVSLTRDGNPVSVTAEPLNGEDNLEGTAQYASRFALTPADGRCGGTVEIAASARNYAGKPLAQAYTGVLDEPVLRPVGIAVEGTAAVVLHDENGSISLVLRPGLPGRTLTAESLTPSLLELETETVTTGAGGAAELAAAGLLPGTAVIRVTEPDSGLTELIKVQVAMEAQDIREPQRPEPVSAVLTDGTPVADGCEVESGTLIALTTATAGAEIWYTLDGGDPAQGTAMRYDGPISVTEDLVISAVAFQNGVYGERCRIAVTVRDEETEEPGGGVVSGGGAGGTGQPSALVEGGGGRVQAGRGTVTILPDEGYRIASVTVNGTAVAVPESGVLTGLAPGDRVVVTFEKRPEGGSPFLDVPESAWYYESAVYVWKNGMMDGVGGGAFGPELTTTRGMVVTVLHRLEGSPAAEPASFPDVAEGRYYAAAVAWAAANGIVNGGDNGLFRPDEAITREQLAAILYRYAGYKGYDTAAPDTLDFPDGAQASAYAVQPLAWAAAEGIILGTGDGRLVPGGNASRAELAEMLMRLCRYLAAE